MWWRWLLLLGLAVPLAAAAEPLTFAVSSLQATGATVATGNLAAFDARSPQDEAAMGWTMELAGDSNLVLETARKVAVGNAVAYQPAPPDVRKLPAGEVWAGRQWMNGSYVYIRDVEGGPAPHFRLETQSTRVQAAKPECVEASPQFGGQSRPMCRDAVQTSVIGGLTGPSVLAVEGTFDIVVWGWELENSTSTIVTGQTSTAMPVPNLRTVDLSSVSGRISSGVLTMRLGAMDNSMFGSGLILSTDGYVILDSALQSPGQAIQLEGKSVINIEPENSAIRVSVISHESLTTASLIPPTPQGSAAASSAPGPQRFLWIGAVVSLCIAALVFAWLRRPSDVERASTAIEAGRHGKAAALARRDSVPPSASVILQVIAQIKAGNLGEAERLLRRKAAVVDAAAREFLFASISASRQDKAAAEVHLAASLRLDPAYRFEAAMNSELRKVLAVLEATGRAGGGEAYT